MNVKSSFADWEEDPEYTLKRVEEKITSKRIWEYENQFNEFLQKETPGANVYFTPVHLLAQFQSMKKDGPHRELADRLSVVSGFRQLEKTIIETIRLHGCEYRLKCYLDTVIKPLQECANTLFQQSLINGGYGRILIQARRNFDRWKADEYESTCMAMIQRCALGEANRINEEIPLLVEDHYEDSNLVSVWKQTVDENRIKQSVKNCCYEMVNVLRHKTKSIFNDFVFDTRSVSPDVTISPGETVVNWKRVWDWSGLLLSSGLAIVATFWWGPAGWIAAGVSIVTMIGDLLFDDIELKRKQARNSLQTKLFAQVEKICKNMETKMREIYSDTIIKNFYMSIRTSMNDACSAIFELAKKQREIAGSLSRTVTSLNKILIDKILELNHCPVPSDLIPLAGRIPGEITLLLTNDKIGDDVKRILGTSLKETVLFVGNSNKTWSLLRHILGLEYEKARSVLSYEEKINVAHLISDGSLSPEFRARILLAQQLTCTPISLKENKNG